MSKPSLVHVKKFLMRKDAISPDGGRKPELKELRSLPKGDKEELCALAYEELMNPSVAVYENTM